MNTAIIKSIIFDFDGVLVDSTQIKLEAFTELFKPFGNDIVSRVQLHHNEHGGMSRFEKFNFYYNNFLERQLNHSELVQLGEQFSNLVFEKIVNSPLVDGVIEFFEKNKFFYKFFISSGTPTEELIQILEKKNIIRYFKSIYGSPENKIYHVKKILSENQYRSFEVVYVGDAINDYYAAKENGVNFIGRVTSDSRIENLSHIIKDFTDLEDVLQELQTNIFEGNRKAVHD